MVQLYHYTDQHSYNAIQREGCIRPSNATLRGERGPGGRHGFGVYLSDMNLKQYDSEAIARNNYRAGWEANLQKTDSNIGLNIPDRHPCLECLGSRKCVFRGPVHSSMFTSEGGANKDWAAAIVVAGSIVLGASLVGAFSAYQDKKQAQELRRVGQEKKRRKMETKALLEEVADISVDYKCLKITCVPSDFVASSRDIGADVDACMDACTRYLAHGGLLVAALGFIFF